MISELVTWLIFTPIIIILWVLLFGLIVFTYLLFKEDK